MALLLLEGFDKYGATNANSVAVNALLIAGEWTTAGSTNVALVAGLSSTGQAFQFSNLATALSKTLPSSYSRLIGGCRFSSNLASSFNTGFQFLDAGTVQCTITINGTTGTISLRNGAIGSATVLATSAGSVSASSIHYLEWDITFGNSASYQVWLDGVSLFSGTGDTTTTANNTASQFAIVSASGGATLLTVDDLYLFDTSGSFNNAVLLTSPRIETTFPISDSAVQFTMSAGILGSSVSRTAVTNGPTANSLVLRRFVPAAAGTLNSITIVPAATNASVLFRGVVYSDSSGAAGTLLSSGATQTGCTANTAKDLPLTTPQSLSAGTPYWLGYMADVSVTMQQTDGLASAYRGAATFSSGAPGTAPAMTSGQTTYHFWGNLTGVSSANYSINAQPPAGTYSYLSDSTVGHEDLYGFTPLSATPATVHAVAMKAYCARSDSGARTVSLRIKSSATDGGGSSTGQTPATSFGWLSSVFTQDPNGPITWTGPNLDAATAGFKVDA